MNLRIAPIVIAGLLCASCVHPKTENPQTHLFRISMAETSAGTKVTLNDRSMSLEEIGQVISTGGGSRKRSRVLLLIDPKVPTSRFFDAMDMLRGIGMDETAAIVQWGNPEQAAHTIKVDGEDDLLEPHDTSETDDVSDVEVK